LLQYLPLQWLLLEEQLLRTVTPLDLPHGTIAVERHPEITSIPEIAPDSSLAMLDSRPLNSTVGNVATYLPAAPRKTDLSTMSPLTPVFGPMRPNATEMADQTQKQLTIDD
jgi:hypothetical protein